jgi:hypothetical protein
MLFMTNENELLKLYKKLKSNEVRRLVAVTRKLQQKYGPQVADEIAEVLTEDAHDKWNNMDKGDAGLKELYRLMWEKRGGVIEREVVTDEDNQLRLRVNRCFFADEYKKLNAQDLGYRYCCMCEYPVVDVFNPRIRFRRHDTLMQNAGCCDHCYRIIEE